MAGMDRNTGRWIGGWQHTSQSLGDVLSTPVETRVLRRMYGAAEDGIVDKPIHPGRLTRSIMTVAVPIARWEPRVRLQHVHIAAASVLGKLGLALTVLWRPRALHGDMRAAGEQKATLS